MPRKTQAKRDYTSAIIVTVAHILVLGVIGYWAHKTGRLEQIRRVLLQAVRSEKKEQKPEPPRQTQRTPPPKLPPINTGAEPKAGSGARRAVASDAPAAAGESFFADTREQKPGASTGDGGGAKRAAPARAETAPPRRPPAPPTLRPPPPSSIKQLLAERAKASAVVESFGTEQISKSGVSDAGEIVSRISGASLAEGKFAVVRGLADRYTLATLNGADIPSADPNRRAVQLDLFPAQFISRVDVNKTFQPDLPGGFAGGAIDIVTRSFPERPLISVSIGASYNPQANLQDDYLITDQGSTDRFALDDGTRGLPAAAAATSPAGTIAPLPAAIKDTFGSRQIAPESDDSGVNHNLALAFGDTTTLFGRRFGVLGGLNYKSDYNFYDAGFVAKYTARHPTNSVGLDQSWTKSDARAVIEYTWGAMVSLAYEVSRDHELGFNFVYVQTAEDEARRLRGRDPTLTSPDADADPNYLDQSVLHWTERNLTYYQMQGKHDFPGLLDARMTWVASLASTTQNEPDHRFFQFFAQPGDPDDPSDDFYGPDGPTKPSRPTRIFRELAEDNVNLRADWTLPVASYTSQENSLKTGVAFSQSEQTLFTRAFEVRATGNHPFLSTGDPASYLAPENNPYVNYFNFPANFQYVGDQTIKALYGMGTWSATEWLRLVGGMRHESTDIEVDTSNPTLQNERSFGSIHQDDLLPAINATILLRSNLQVRAAWSQTVIRPTYREISDAELYDLALGRTISGNPDLTMSASENADLRLEWYPRPGELVSFSAFRKRIDDAIELSAVTVDNENITYENYERADVAGLEVELRKNFRGFWGPPWDQFSVGLNYAYIKSEVDLTPVQRANRQGYGDDATTRPLYDQPEYVINGDLTWDNFTSGTSITINGGVTGRRLVLVGLASPDEFEEPAPYLDISISQRLNRQWRIKFTAKNLLDPDFQVTQTWPSIGEVPIKSYSKGMSFGISVAYDF